MNQTLVLISYNEAWNVWPAADLTFHAGSYFGFLSVYLCSCYVCFFFIFVVHTVYIFTEDKLLSVCIKNIDRYKDWEFFCGWRMNISYLIMTHTQKQHEKGIVNRLLFDLCTWNSVRWLYHKQTLLSLWWFANTSDLYKRQP